MARREEILSLTGLRGVAALLVVAHHAEAATLVDRTHVFFRGQTWVDLFFVLSGYVMALVYLSATRPDFRAFYAARFSRIYPLHIVAGVAMIFAAAALARFHHLPLPARINPVQAVREVTLTMALPYLGSIDIWNYPAWSISVEWWVYLTIFPLLALWGTRLGAGVWISVSLAALAALAVFLFTLPADAHFTRGWAAVLRGAVGFIAGYGVRRIELDRPHWSLPPLVHDALCLVTVLAIYVVPPFIGYRDAWAVMLLFPFIVWGCLTTTSVSTRILSSRPIVYLGTISYSIYLMHALIVSIWHAVASSLHFERAVLAVPICMAAAVAVASITYVIIEKPARNQLRRLAAPKGPAAIKATA